MPSTDPTEKIALALTGLFVVAVLLWGYLVAQQLLLSVLIALVGVLVYVAWRLFGGTSRRPVEP
ncbi:hypothetical protein AUR64_19345 [Haloprofundus marisrubri]|uniref:Uncharacterized protein n=1 Tax=Haloprofundus marisrubri TaxID=1514971 RepID=A0A0W1R515_9EURY|nr:hypothetical protein [Haloprofundus marisrubri]KTG08388.1 hypothetical protein AUR64_19345 [Haloprofundus marisrubri]